MTTTNGRPQGVRSLGRIGLWGAPECGKTTFGRPEHSGKPGSSPGSDDLRGGRRFDRLPGGQYVPADQGPGFPPATNLGGNQYSWVLRMETEVPERRRFGRQTMTTVPLEMNLDLLDEPGRVFADVPDGPAADTGQ